MNLKIGVIGLLAASNIASAATGERSTECLILQRPNFFQEMQYLASNSERCRGLCNTENARVGSEVAIKILSDHLTRDEYESVESSVAWTLSNIGNVIGDDVKIRVRENVEGNYPTKIIVLPVTEVLDRALIKQGMPGLTPMEYVVPHRAVLIEGGCSARFFVTGTRRSEIVSLAYVFISSDSLKDESDLDLCVLEEITQVFGLFGDPPGNASLFDDGNVDFSGERPIHSEKTNAMLRFMYSDTSMDEESFDNYRSTLCES